MHAPRQSRQGNSPNKSATARIKHHKEQLSMNKNTTAIRRELESHLKRATPNRGARESIRIHQVADPLDMTQQAAEREIAVINLDRGTEMARRVRAAIDR